MEVGGRKLVHSCSLIVPDGETALIDFTVELWNLRFRIDFKIEEVSDGKSAINVKGSNGGNEAIITFHNWTNPLGTATTKPFAIGKTSTNREILMMAAHWRIGDVNKLDVQFLLGAPP